MKTQTCKSFPSYAMYLLAAIIDKALSSTESCFIFAAGPYSTTGEAVANERLLELTESPFFKRISQEEINNMMHWIYCKLGLKDTIQVLILEDSRNNFCMECSAGLNTLHVSIGTDFMITGLCAVVSPSEEIIGRAA